VLTSQLLPALATALTVLGPDAGWSYSDTTWRPRRHRRGERASPAFTAMLD
jgi:hypothetical protein